MDKLLNFLIKVIHILKPNQERWIVAIFIGAGISMLSQRIWEPYAQAFLDKYFQINIPDTTYTGWAFVAIGVGLHLLNMYVKYLAKPHEVIELNSALALEFNPGTPCEITEPNNANGHAIRSFRINVSNIGNTHLTDCLVKIEAMRLFDGSEFNNAFLPIGLITQQQAIQKRKGGNFNLRIGESKLIEVACLDETNTGSEIILRYEASYIPNTVPRNDYIIKLTAYGGSIPVSKVFRMLVDENGFFIFYLHDAEEREEQEWKEESMIVDFNWPVASGFQRAMEKNGFKLLWSRADKVQSRLSDNYELMYWKDKNKRVKRRIELKDQSILIGKMSNGT